MFTHILALLHRFAACIADDTQTDLPDVTLYDRLRVTSALAACLYQHHAATNSLTDDGLRRPTASRCVLLVGDLSGIQQYLFDIATVGAGGVARRLRARSFFLQMLPEIACLKVLRAFGLPLANVLMSSGGKFYILLPNLDDTADRIRTLETQGNRWLLLTVHGELALNLAWTDLRTPKHASWLEMAECELSVLRRQCWDRRINSRSWLAREVEVWEEDRNMQEECVDWQFRAPDARIKLRRLYPAIASIN